MKRIWFSVAVCAAVCLNPPSIGESRPNEKAQRYFSALEKRPFAESLFDRFFDTWLETASIEDCESFLKTQAPSSPTKQLILGRFYLRRGDSENATTAFSEVTTNGAASGEHQAGAWLQLAKISGTAREFENALTRLENAENAYLAANFWNVKTETEVIKLRGTFLIRAGKRDAALTAWTTLLEKRAGDDVLREDLVALLANEGIWDKAIEQQEILIQNAEDNVYDQVLRKIALGQLYRRSGRRDEALEKWRNTLPQVGHATWIERELIGLIESTFRRGDNLTGWKSELESLILSEPKRMALKVEQAVLLADLREDGPAIDAWKRILDLTPGDQKLRLQFARTLAQLKRPAEAAAQLAKLVESNPTDAELRFELATLYHQAKNSDATRTQLMAFMEHSDGSEYSILRVARQFSNYEMPADAEVAFEKLVAKFPDSTSASSAFATFLYDAGKKEPAIERWKKIAQTGGVTQLIQTANQLTNRVETEIAFSVLEDRLPDFPTNRSVLELLCELAIALDRSAEAAPWALKLVNESDNPSALENAILLAGQVAKASGENGVSDFIEKLEGDEKPSVKSQCLLADLYRQNGDSDKAISILEKAADSAANKDAEFPLAILALVWRRSDEFGKAAATVERMVAIEGGHTTANLQQLVRDHKRAEAPEEALKWVAEWRKFAPGNQLTWLEEADLLNQLGRISESLELLRGAARRFEKESSVLTKLADAYNAAGFPLEAERTLWRLYESSDDPWKQRGMIDRIMNMAQQARRQDEIIKRFEKRHQNNSQSVEPLLALAAVYRQVNRPDDQRAALLKAGRIAPENIQLAHQIAALDQKEGRIDSAIRVLEDAQKRDKSPRTAEFIARLHLQNGDVAKAIATYESMPDGGRYATPENIIGMAHALIFQGEWDLTANFLEPKLTLHPQNGTMHYLRAVALLESGQTDKAVAAFSELMDFEMTQVSPPATGMHSLNPAKINQLFARLKTQYRNFGQALNYRSTVGDGTIWAFASNSSWGSQNGSPIITPSTKSELHNFAIAHLAALENDGDIDIAALKKLEPWEREFIDLVLSKSPSNAFEFFEKWIDEPEVALLFVSRSIPLLGRNLAMLNPNPNPSDFEARTDALADRALVAIRKKYDRETQFFATASLLQYSSNTDDKMRRDLVELAEQFETLTPQIVQAFIGNALGKNMNSPSPDSELTDLDRRFVKLLIDFETPENQQVLPRGNTTLFSMIINVLMHAGETEAWTAKVLREQRAYEDSPQVYNSFLKQNHEYPNSKFTAGIAPDILNLRLPYHGRNGQSHPFSENQVTEIKNAPPKFKGKENRLLRLHFSQVDKKLHNEVITEIQSDAETGGELTAYEWITLAGISSQKNDADGIALTLSYLNKARKAKDATATVLHAIDLMIVTAIPTQAPSPELRKQGIEAGWRYLNAKDISLGGNYWQISENLQRWGEPRAKVQNASTNYNTKLQAKAALLGFGQGRSYGSQQRAQIAGSNLLLQQMLNFQQLHQRLEKNPTQANASLVAKRLLSFSPGVLIQSRNSFEQQFDHLIEKIRQNNLIDPTLELVKPKPNSRSLDRVRFATLLDLFGKKPEALADYEKLIAEFPEDDGLRRRRIQLISQIHPEQLITELQEYAAASSTEASDLNHLLTILSNLPFKDMNTRLGVAEQLVEFLKKIPQDQTPAPGMPSPVAQLQNAIGNQFRDNNDAVYYSITGNLNDPFADSQPKLPKDPAVLAQFKTNDALRRKLFIDVCEMGLSNPQYASASFQQLVAALEPGKVNDEKLLEHCQTALETLINSHHENIPIHTSLLWGNARPPERDFSQNVPGWKTKALPISAPAPVPWLIEYAFRTNQKGLIDESTLLDRKHPISNQIIAVRDLYFSAPEEIDETVKRSRELATNFPAFTTFLQRALSMRPDADKNFNPDPLIFEELASSNRANAQQMAQIRMSQIAMTDGPEEALKYLEKVMEAASGMTKPQQLSFLSRINNAQGCSGIVMQFAHQQGFSAAISFNPMAVYRINGNGSADSNLLFGGLRNFGFFKDLESFNTLPTSDFLKLQRGEEQRSLLAVQAKELQSWMRRSENRNKIPLLISKINQSDTFGAQVIAASLAEIPANAILSVFDSHASALEKLSPERQVEIASFAADILDIQRMNSQPSVDQRNTLRWILRNSAQGELKKIDAYAAAKTISELGIAPENLASTVSKDLQIGIMLDSEKTRLAFENISVLGEAAVIAGQIPRRRESFTTSLLEYSITRSTQADAFAFAISLLKSESLPPFYQQDSRIAQTASGILKNGKKPEDKVKILEAWVKEVYADLDLDSNLSVTVGPLYEIVRGQGSEFPPLVLKWARSRDGIGLYPKLAPHIELAAMLSIRINEHFDEWFAANDRLSKLLDAPDLSDSARASLANLIFRLDNYRISGPLSKKAVAQLLILWERHGQNVDPHFENQAIDTIFEQRNSLHRVAYQWDDWDAVSEKIVDQFSSTFPQNSATKMRIERGKMRNDTIRNLLTLTLENRRFPEAQLMFTESGEQLNSSLPVFYELVRNDADELAGQMLRKNWRALLQYKSSQPYFDRELAFRAESFCDGFETDQEWLRWVGRLLLVEGRDVYPHHRVHEQALGWPDQKWRLYQASRIMPVDQFPDTESLQLVFAILSISPEAVARQSNAMIRSAEGITIGKIESERDLPTRQLMYKSYLVRLNYKLAKGDVPTFETAINEMKALPKERDRIDWASTLRNSFKKTLANNWELTDVLTGELASLALSLPSSDDSLLKEILARSIVQFIFDRNNLRLKKFFTNLDANTQEQLSRTWQENENKIKDLASERLFDKTVNRRLVSKTGNGPMRFRHKLRSIEPSTLGFKSYLEIRVEKFLAAENVAALNLKPDQFDDHVMELVRSFRDSISQHQAIIDKAASLIEKELRSPEGWHHPYDNGWHPRSEIFQNFMKRSYLTEFDLRLFLDLLWNDTPADLSISWSHKYGQKDRAERMWRYAKRNSEDNATELEIFENLLSEFRKQLPENEADWGNIAVLRPIFYETCRLWTDRPNDLAAIVNHIDENLSDDVLAREFGLAARTWWASFWTPPIVDIKEPERWATAAMKTLNGELSPNTRAMLNRFYLYRPERNCPVELRKKITADEAELLNSDTAVNGHEITMVLNFFEDFEKNDAWKKTAQRFLDGWNYRNRFRGKPASEGIDFKPNAAAVTSMMQLVIELGDPKQTAEFLEIYAPEIESAPLSVPVLIRGGEHELAAKILNQNINKVTLVNGEQANFVSTHHVYYDAKMHRELSGFLKTLDNPETRFFAEMVAASAPNSEYTREGKFNQTTLVERLKNVAGRFSETEFSSIEVENRALFLLCKNWENAAALEPVLAKNFSTTVIESVPALGNNTATLDPILQPLIAYAVEKIHSDANPKPFQELATKLSATPASRTNWNRHHSLSQLGHAIKGMLYSEYSTLDKTQRRAAFDALGIYITSITDHKDYWAYQYSYLLQSAIADDLKARADLEKFRMALPATQKKNLERAFKKAQPHAFTVLRSLYRGQPELIQKGNTRLHNDPWWIEEER